MTKNRQFIIDALGIFISYFYFGILQEKVTKTKYTYSTLNSAGETVYETEKFTYPLSFVFILCVTNYVLAKIAARIWRQEQDTTTKFYYATVSVTYLLAMICSNMALQWISYPTQVVGKSAKPIPVLILAVLLGKKSYPLRKYVFVFLIVVGVVLFMFKEKEGRNETEFSFGLGELLLILSLTMDGLTGAVQERIRAEHKPTGIQMMLAGNGWSSLFLAVILLFTGEIFKFIEFSQRHPSVYFNLVLVGFTSGVGQLFLYSMVSHFGPLSVSIVTTTRKFFTVLGSVIIFGNVLTRNQWIGAILVFTGLFLDIVFAKSKAPAKKPSEK